MAVRGGDDSNVLKCPFCDAPLGELREIETGFGSTFTGGRCSCGAVYVYDHSGHSLGDAYVDALTFACNNDWDMAWSLVPEVDYDVVELSFDSRRKKFSAARRGVRSTYLFVHLKGDAETGKGRPGSGEGQAPG